MKIEKQIKLITRLDSDEILCFQKVVNILRQIEEMMEKHECDTFTCCDEYAYEIEDLKSVITDLECFMDIDEIFV